MSTRIKKLWSSVFYMVNKTAKEKQRITEGSNVTRPGATIILTQPQRFGIGLDDYMQSIRGAENVDFTRRVRIASPWFLRFLGDALDAEYWGFTLVQFYINEKGWIDYYLVPRKHVDPVLRVIKTRQDDLMGEPFDNYADLLMIRGKEPLGILARTAPYVIYKRGTIGDWAQLAEIFGRPIRKYTYDASDPEARRASLEAAESQGGASVFLCPDGSKLEFIEPGNLSGSSDMYSALTDRYNAEMSKAVLGNTLTTEASKTGTQALGTVHNKVEQELIEQDALSILNLLNYDMTEQFAALGINTQGGEFVYVEEADLGQVKTKAELLEKAVNVFGLPMADDYLYEQLNIEKPNNYEQLKAEMEKKKKDSNPFAPLATPPVGDYPQEEVAGKCPKNRARSFFGHAPQTDGALDW